MSSIRKKITAARDTIGDTLKDIANSEVLKKVEDVLDKVDNISTSLKRVEIASYIIAATFVLVAIIALIVYIVDKVKKK